MAVHQTEKIRLGFGVRPRIRTWWRAGYQTFQSFRRGAEMQSGFTFILRDPRRYEDRGLRSAKPSRSPRKKIICLKYMIGKSRGMDVTFSIRVIAE